MGHKRVITAIVEQIPARKGVSKFMNGKFNFCTAEIKTVSYLFSNNIKPKVARYENWNETSLNVFGKIANITAAEAIKTIIAVISLPYIFPSITRADIIKARITGASHPTTATYKSEMN